MDRGNNRYAAAAARQVPVWLYCTVLHLNTSCLNQQSYRTSFTGDEFFLTDHRVSTEGDSLQKVLPGVAYLEMARAAIEQALPIQPKSSILELRNTVWLRPVIVTEHRQVSIALLADDNDQIDYEIYTIEDEKEVIHCQGQAVFSRPFAPAKLGIEQLKGQMGKGRLEASHIYAMFANMGLHYGPAHQGIVAIYLGENQLITQLRLPRVVETSRLEYVLHPSLMDSVLQASLGLIFDLNHIPSKPHVPFVLGSLRIMLACTQEMTAWVRYSEGSKREDRVIKMDIDLCDHEGNVCVQMRGFATRGLEHEVKSSRHKVMSDVNVDKSAWIKNHPSFDSAFYQKLITGVAAGDFSIEEAVALG